MVALAATICDVVVHALTLIVLWSLGYIYMSWGNVTKTNGESKNVETVPEGYMAHRGIYILILLLVYIQYYTVLLSQRRGCSEESMHSNFHTVNVYAMHLGNLLNLCGNAT